MWSKDLRKVFEKQYMMGLQILSLYFTGRFLRFNRMIGDATETKSVYCAYDTLDGVEVAWHCINTTDMSRDDRQKLQRELEFLGGLRHKNIMDFHNRWRVGQDKVGCTIKNVFVVF